MVSKVNNGVKISHPLIYMLLVCLKLLANFSGNRLSDDELEQKFGNSKEMMKTAARALEGKTHLPNDIDISIAVDIAAQVASCGYEHGSGWGKQVKQPFD